MFTLAADITTMAQHQSRLELGNDEVGKTQASLQALSTITASDAHADNKSDVVDASAVTRLFAVVELMEQVLIDVDMHTLILAQRVCRQFFAVITSSLRLQQKLYFAPDSMKDISLPLEDRLNPMWSHKGFIQNRHVGLKPWTSKGGLGSARNLSQQLTDPRDESLTRNEQYTPLASFTFGLPEELLHPHDFRHPASSNSRSVIQLKSHMERSINFCCWSSSRP